MYFIAIMSPEKTVDMSNDLIIQDRKVYRKINSIRHFYAIEISNLYVEVIRFL